MLLVVKKEVYIKDYEKILIMEENLLHVMMQGFSLSIEGHCFEILYLDRYEIHLYGEIQVIRYV